MNRVLVSIKIKIVAAAAMLLISLTACQNSYFHSSSDSEEAVTQVQDAEVQELVIADMHELLSLFDAHRYEFPHSDSVPRIYLQSIPQSWPEQARTIPVKEKKQMFFSTLMPLVIRANEQILKDRQRMSAINVADAKDMQWLRDMATRYRVSNHHSTEQIQTQLKQRVDIVPASLVLAQSAEESGWGTSRFSLEGNALFGQWDYSGKGMRPKQQRGGMGNYGVARFDNLQASIQSYMLNLNTHRSYQRFRELRASLRETDQTISGHTLASALDSYSERGNDYVRTIQGIIRFNHLQQLDIKQDGISDILLVRPAA